MRIARIKVVKRIRVRVRLCVSIECIELWVMVSARVRTFYSTIVFEMGLNRCRSKNRRTLTALSGSEELMFSNRKD